MIKDVMVWLDGAISDEVRLAAAADIARRLESRVIIGLFLNPLPLPVAVDADVGGAVATADLLERAREAGDRTERLLAQRLSLLERPVEIRRFDVLAGEISDIAAREARSADTFVAIRPNGAMDPEQLVEGVLFGSGRNIYLVPETERPKIGFDHILVAWNAAGRRPGPWPKPCRFCTRRKRSRLWSRPASGRPRKRRSWALMPSIISGITISTPPFIASRAALAKLEPS